MDITVQKYLGSLQPAIFVPNQSEDSAPISIVVFIVVLNHKI